MVHHFSNIFTGGSTCSQVVQHIHGWFVYLVMADITDWGLLFWHTIPPHGLPPLVAAPLTVGTLPILVDMRSLPRSPCVLDDPPPPVPPKHVVEDECPPLPKLPENGGPHQTRAVAPPRPPKSSPLPSRPPKSSQEGATPPPRPPKTNQEEGTAVPPRPPKSHQQSTEQWVVVVVWLGGRCWSNQNTPEVMLSLFPGLCTSFVTCSTASNDAREEDCEQG